MKQFIGRKKELQLLERIWQEDRNKTCVLYGRRRIGKTALLKEFSKSKHTIFLEFVQGSLSSNLHLIAESVSANNGSKIEDYRFLTDAFRDILEICRNRKTLVVLDEYPYLLSSSTESASAVQHLTDAITDGTDSMIVICGSSISIMKKETTEYDKPLYGRFSTFIKLGPLSLGECADMHPNLSNDDLIRLYLTVGGVPRYHLDDCDTYQQYLEKHFLSENADLKDEGELLIAAEYYPRGKYTAIISAISDGASNLKEISEKSHVERTACSRCLDELIATDMVGIVHPMFGSPKRPTYRIKDPLIGFCMDIVNASAAYSSFTPAEKYEELVPKIDTFLGFRFEDLCGTYVGKNYKCTELGKWWGPNGSGEICEIDIAATVMLSESKNALLGECKFRKKQMHEDVLDRLITNSHLVRTDLTMHYILFSLSGFDDDLVERAEEADIRLIGTEELIRGS